ncbi:hypothetical protein EK21DRAFT_40819, partial [Setomelanomma holmii]
SVQAYSIPTAELLPSQQPHPSPPNVIALSNDGSVLLSASPGPPTVYLQDRRWGGSAPVNFRPTDALTPVSCAAFQTLEVTQPLSYTNFLLGFQDGKMVLYRLFLPTSPKHHKTSGSSHMPSFQLQPVRVGAIKKLHKATMGGVTAAEFIPGYKSRIVSTGHDGRCRLIDFEGGGKHVSGPAACLAVMNDGPQISRGRKSKDLLLGGDSTVEEERVYEGSQTLIAIGTQAGKVLVFNVLGLLIHEIEMGTQVISIEWVGDMSEPSMLPNRVTFMTPEPQPVMDALLEEFEDQSAEDSTGTVRKTVSPFKNDVRQRPISTGPDLFSNDCPKHVSVQPARRPSDVSNGSPMQVRRTCEPRRKSLIRPRIATETFKSPAVPIRSLTRLKTQLDSQASQNPGQEQRKQSQMQPPPPVSSKSLARQLPKPRKSSSTSHLSETSDQEFFTPPSTRRDKGKAPARLASPTNSAIVTDVLTAPKPPNGPKPPPSPGTTSSLPWQRCTSLALKVPQRQVTVEAPDTPPSLDWPSSVPAQSASRVIRNASSQNPDRAVEAPHSTPP